MSKSFLPQDFMDRVVAWPGPDGPGYVNLHWSSPEARGGQFRGRPFKNLQDFMDLAQKAAVKPSIYKEIYFCLSTQRVTGKLVHHTPVAHRHQHQATALKALWIDVDVKPEKGYPTLDEAMAAITAFVKAACLPPPSAIVFSGGGVHVYWISDKPLTVAEWDRYAQGLKFEIQKHGLKCDAGLTTDAARVLRVPGTYNNKIAGEPRPVLLKWLGDSYDFAVDPAIARLATLVVVSTKLKVTGAVTSRVRTAFDLTNFPAGKMHPLLMGVLDPVNDALAKDINLYGDLPLKIDEMVKGCSHFQDCARTHGEKHSQPLWALTLLACTFVENGENYARIFSKGYPSYDPGETEKKYEEKLLARAQNDVGWPSCQAFEDAGAGCKACPFYHKIRSPLHLAERVSPPTPIYTAPPPPEELMLPEGYCLDDRGRICAQITKTLKGGEQVDEEVLLFMSELRNPVCQSGQRAFLCETSLDKGRWGPVKLVEEHLYSDQAMLKQLRMCGVKPYVPSESRVRHFMTSWMDKLDEAKARIQTIPFGWLRDGEEGVGKEIGFAYGGQVFMADGTTQKSGYADPEIERSYRPRGSKDPWYEALKIITDQHRPALEAIVATSFAAPLVSLIGKNNCVGCGWSNESGAHKSTGQIVGLAVWGNPRLTKESPMSSVKGIVHKLGQLKNLPVYWDEISDDEKMDSVRKLLGITTEGRGATVLQQNRTFFNTDEWQTLMFIGANKSLVQNILTNTKDTDAQLQRVFEFYVDKKHDTLQEADVSILLNSLDYNYGQLGLAYSQYLGTKPKEVREYVKAVLDRFNKQVAHQSQERFRAAMAACIYAGAEIANIQMKATFNLPELWEFLKAEYMSQRQVIKDAEIVGGTTTNTVNAVTMFLKASTRNALWVKSLPVVRPGAPEAIVHMAGPNAAHPDPVHVRLAVTDRVMQISRDRLMTYLKNVGHNGSAVIAGLKKHYGMTEMRRINLAAGAQVLGGREHVLNIPIPVGSPFAEILYTHTPVDERPADALIPTLEVTAAVTFVKEGDLYLDPSEVAKIDLELVKKATS